MSLIPLAVDSWMPHGMCWNWNPWLLWSIVISHAITGFSYYTIPITIILLTRKVIAQLSMELPRQLYLTAWLFVAFVAACGTGHFIDILTVWVPIYGITAIVQAIVAIISFFTAIHLMPTAEGAINKIVAAEQNEISLAQKYQESEFFFQLSPVPMYRKNEAGQIIDCNQAVQRLLGLSRQDMVGKRDSEFLSNKEGAAKIEATDQELFAMGEGASIEIIEVATGRDGKERRFVSKKSIYRDPGSDKLCLSGVSIDVTDQTAVQESLEQVNQSLQRVNQELDDSTDEMEKMFQMSSAIYAAKNYQEIHQLMKVAANLMLEGLSGALYTISNSGSHAEMRSSWGVVPSDQVFAPDQCWSLRRGGTTNLLQQIGTGLLCDHIHSPVSGSHLCAPLNGVINTASSFGVLYLHSDRPISPAHQRVAKNLALCISLALSNLEWSDRLREQALRDELTGLHNLRYLRERFPEEAAYCDREHVKMAFLLLDLDHFKHWNDLHGHDAGNQALKAVGRYLKQSVRRHSLSARWGGEEFCVILTGVTTEDAKNRAESIRRGISSLDLKHGTLTVSIGISFYPDHGETLEQVFAVADTALYRSKTEGRDRVTIEPLIYEETTD